MTDTAINALTYVPENTTDPAAGLNITIDQIDALLQCTVLAIQDAPPGGPGDGDRYIVGTGSGDWAGEDDQLAVYRATGDFWDFYAAKIVINLADGLLYINNAGWLPYIQNDTPSSSADTGSPGQIKYDGSFIYVCTATDTWLRAAIATW